MQQLPLQLEQTNYAGNKASGFRLHRYEVLNWGTFDKRPWVIDLQGQTALVTGANGSGKSTLVDGLLTLLVPNRGRNYNLASANTQKRERSEKSYVQGAYDHTRSEESYSSKSKVLRKDGIPTILLAYFYNADRKEKVTMTQVLWIADGTVKKFFVIAKDQLNIATDFNNYKDIRELKKNLKKKQVDIFDNFKKYSATFQRLLGLQSEKALDLFNQTVSVKEITSLNDFVRQHMLQKTDVQTKIQDLLKSFEDLTVSYNLIEQARQQLELLIPLNEEANNYNNLTQEVRDLDYNLSIAPAYFANEKSKLLEKEINKIEDQLIKVTNEITISEEQFKKLQQQEKNLEFAIQNDTVGRRIEELKREIQQNTKEVTNKKKKAVEYDRLAELLQLPLYHNKDTFFTAKEQGDNLEQKIADVLSKLENQRDELVSQRKEVEKQQQELEKELNSLRQRKSQIPQQNLKLRDTIADKLNLDKTELPFVGELLKVRDDASKWEGAIERLLHSFGLNILVSEINYQQLNSYVNNNNLKGYLSYYRVKSLPLQATQRAFNPNKVSAKLEIKPDNKTFSQWLKQKLAQSFNYTCCDTEEQFNKEAIAITKTGLIKQSGERHIKDDRTKIGDRRNYILGWDNQEKIAAIEAELNSVNQELAELKKQTKTVEKKRSQRDQQKSWLQDFMNFKNFTEIDWRFVEQEKQKLNRDLEELEASSDRLKQLTSQLKEVQQKLDFIDSQKSQLNKQQGSLENKLESINQEQSNCQQEREEVTSQQLIEFAERNNTRLRLYQLNIETIDSDRKKIISKLREEFESKQNKQSESKQSILMQLLNFKNQYAETTIDKGIDFESRSEYIKLKHKIEQDDLPRHQQRFEELMTKNIVNSIIMFINDLQREEEKIEDNINNLNNSLKKIDYTNSTYIKLCYEKNRDSEIRKFRNDLKICLGDASKQTLADNKERFENIKKFLIEPFKNETRLTNKVTDVRNWLDFAAKEYNRANDQEERYYIGSASLSGGQKRKLACTILASAISYSFGLHSSNFSNKSFRFVVIDEAFSKLDDQNARYAMNLFKTLNLQLLMITPQDKIQITEPYISTLHIVFNQDTRDYSSIKSMSISQFQQDRTLAVTKNSD